VAFGEGFVDAVGDNARTKKPARKFVKVTWWRPHGQTAIAPGLKRMTLRVRVTDEASVRGVAGRSPGETIFPSPGQAGELFDAPRTPSAVIMRHLIELFREHFGCQFPFLDLDRYLADLQEDNGSVFLLNCIAATAARSA
jgi:hypothetical protein